MPTTEVVVKPNTKTIKPVFLFLIPRNLTGLINEARPMQKATMPIMITTRVTSSNVIEA